MKVDLGNLNTSATVVRARGFREDARLMGASASGLSEAMWWLEARLGMRLLNRTARSTSLTEAGQRLLSRLRPALSEVEATFDVINSFRERPTGILKLNMPTSAAWLVLPVIILGFLDAYPEIQLEVVTEESFVDILAAGFGAGIHYDEWLKQDMIAVPIGPRSQHFATATAPGYLDQRDRPNHPRDLLDHVCLRGQFTGGAMPSWEFERDGKMVNVDSSGLLLVHIGGAIDLVVDVIVAGVGAVYLYEDWLRPHLASGAPEPALEAWWRPFPGPHLYYLG